MNLLFIKSVCWLMAVAEIQTLLFLALILCWQWSAFVNGWDVHSASAPLTSLWNISALVKLFQK